MSLVADYSSSSGDENSNENSFRKTETRTIQLLPSASVLLSSGAIGEVLNNPFKAAEDARFASLEKHVKMVDIEDRSTIKHGKKICWNYRRGRCKFGNKCNYAHDSDKNLDNVTTNQPDTNNEISKNSNLYQGKRKTCNNSNHLKTMKTQKINKLKKT